MVLLSLAWVLLCAMPYVTLQLQLNGCGPEHNDVTLCDYAAAKVNNFPSVAFTISMWVKAIQDVRIYERRLEEGHGEKSGAT